jgi:hypothetical protein
VIERPSIDRLRELFRHEDGRLFWIWFNRFHPDTFEKEAGSPRIGRAGEFRWVVKIGGRAFKRAHIVFALTRGRWPELQIDHINGDPLDDRPINLREATQMQNAWNHRTRKKRSGLPMGVRLLEGRYQARIGYMKQAINLGFYATAEEAEAVYRAKRKELFGEYAG